MCESNSTAAAVAASDAVEEPLPSDLALFDAHCHPTDIMASIERVPSMRTRVLTVMSTRSQDQDLVASVGQSLAVTAREDLSSASDNKRIIPAFGWHPWFTHQVFDDSQNQTAVPVNDQTAVDKFKQLHYKKVLTPPPDNDFIAQLPTPVLLSAFLEDTKKRLIAHPVALVGEIGLDKSFRLPEKWTPDHETNRDASLTPGGREGRRLSKHHVAIEHQKAIFKSQVALAGDMMRPVSVHGVSAHGLLHDELASTWKGFEKAVVSARERKHIAPDAEDWSSADEDDEEDSDEEKEEDEQAELGRAAGGAVPKRIYKKQPKAAPKEKPLEPRPFPPRICLHSYSGSAELVAQYLQPHVPAVIYFSFSCCVNVANTTLETKLESVLKSAPDDRILIESDLHTAGDEMDHELERMARIVCAAKGWTLREGVEQLAKNYEAFIFG